MSTFFQVIGWYCLLVGIGLGLALWFTSTKDEPIDRKLRRTIAWLVHIGFLYAGIMILTR